MSRDTLILTSYKKGFVVLGNTEPIRASMRGFGAIYNPNLREKTIKGWILSEYAVEKFLQLSSLIKIQDLRQYTLDEILEKGITSVNQ